MLSTAGEVVGGQLQTDPNGRSRGEAIAQLASVAAAQQAVEMLHNAELDGQRLSVSLESRPSCSCSAPPSSTTSRQGLQPGRRVYVGRLPADTSWREVQEIFGPFGEIVQLQLPRDRNARSRGFGIIEYSASESAGVAVRKLQHVELRGRKLVVRDDTQACAF